MNVKAERNWDRWEECTFLSNAEQETIFFLRRRQEAWGWKIRPEAAW